MARAASGAQRVVHAPKSKSPSSASLPEDRVESVTLQPDEEVDWLWATAADGTRYVNDYRIVRRDEMVKPSVGGGWMVFQQKSEDNNERGRQ